MNEIHEMIDVDFRPPGYFWPLGLEKHLLSRVKGARRKEALRALLDNGRSEEIPDLLARSALSADERRAIGRIHPMLMGGEYLPDMSEQEVEIARICIHSTTGDVASVYARRDPKGIAYRVVDEYEGDTLTGDNNLACGSTLSLGELVKFFLGSWPLMDVLEMNYEGDLDSMLKFFWVESVFYPELDALLRSLVIEKFGADVEDPDDCDDA